MANIYSSVLRFNSAVRSLVSWNSPKWKEKGDYVNVRQQWKGETGTIEKRLTALQ